MNCNTTHYRANSSSVPGDPTDLDKATQSQLDRGYRMVEILKQGQFKPLPVADQVMAIFAGAKGYLDKVPRNQVSAWESQFLAFMREQRAEVRNALVKERKLTKEIEAGLRAALDEFQLQYKAPGAAMPAAKPKETNVKEGEPPYRAKT